MELNKAKDKCAGSGGHLPTNVHTKQYLDEYPMMRDFWVGLYKKNGTWIYEDGTELPDGEKNKVWARKQYDPRLNCAVLKSRKLITHECTWGSHVICQADPIYT